MARMAGSDITASPSQLVARTNTFDMEDGLKATNSQHSKSGIRPYPVGQTGRLTVLGTRRTRSLSRWANPGTDSQIPANCAGNWCQSRVCDAFPASSPQNG